MHPKFGLEERILTDFHVHINKTIPPSALIDKLSNAVLGLAVLNRKRSHLLSYEEALDRLKSMDAVVREIDPGIFAKFELGAAHGYILKVQEIISDHHVLAVGIKKDMPDYPDAREAVEEIHKQGGLAILPHPFIVEGKLLTYRKINGKEKTRVRELCEMVDEIEAFNAQNINLFPIIAWMKHANVMAQILALEYGFRGIASSDSHHYEQVKTSGIYLPNTVMSFSAIKEYIEDKNFIKKEKYISIPSFIKGIFPGSSKKILNLVNSHMKLL